MYASRSSEKFPVDLTGGEEKEGKTSKRGVMVDIRELPDVIQAINMTINNREIAEVKIEPKGVSVVTIHRAVKIIAKKEIDAAK